MGQAPGVTVQVQVPDRSEAELSERAAPATQQQQGRGSSLGGVYPGGSLRAAVQAACLSQPFSSTRVMHELVMRAEALAVRVAAAQVGVCPVFCALYFCALQDK